MAYAYQLYHSHQPPNAGLTAVPLINTLPLLLAPDQIYRRRLLPLLGTLRSLHPKDLPILLLLACTYHALGEYDTTLSLSQEMLAIDPDCVMDSLIVSGTNILTLILRWKQ